MNSGERRKKGGGKFAVLNSEMSRVSYFGNCGTRQDFWATNLSKTEGKVLPVLDPSCFRTIGFRFPKIQMLKEL